MTVRKTNTHQLSLLLILCLLFSISTSCGNNGTIEPQNKTETFNLDPRATFLRTDGSDNASDPIIIKLKEFKISSGDVLRLKTNGNFINSPGGSTRDDAIGVFSSSDKFLDFTQLNRVKDAIDAGEERITDNTFDRSQVTDIPEDFRIDRTQIEIIVPRKAKFLFLGNADSKQSDNNNSSVGFSVEVKY